MAWQLKGTYFEHCPCDSVCPCTTSGLTMPADVDRCTVTLAFHVDSGEIDGVDVSDRAVVLVADAPRNMMEGGWRAGVFMDERCSPEQAEKLGAVFSGQAGGPFAEVAPLMGEPLGMEQAAIAFKDDGYRHSVKIGDKVDIEVEDIVQAGQEEPVRISGLGFPAPTLTAAVATRSKVSAFGLDFSHVGKNGHAAPFSFSG
jgi:hypothetical protein